MPSFTYNVELSTKPDRTGRWPVMIRLHLKDQKPGRVTTSVKIANAPKHWQMNKWGKWIKAHPDADAINQNILNEYNRISDQCKKWLAELPDGELLTPAMLAERFRQGGVGDNYFALVDLVMEDGKEQAYSTYTGKLSAVNQFKKFAGQELLLSTVTPGYIQRFQDHLRKTKPRYGTKLKASTINKYFDRLHKIHQEVLVKTGMTRRQAERQSPWILVDPLVEQKVRKGKFSEETIEAIKTKQVQTRRRRVTPDSAFRIWLLSHSLAGMRISDLLFLRYQNFTLDENGEPIQLRYEMLKTGQLMNIPVLEEARALLKAYWNPEAVPTDFVLPFLNKKMKYYQVLSYEQYRSADFETKRQLYNAFSYWDDQINECLSLIEEEAGLKTPLRMHTARHSFAELARTIMQQDKTLTVYDIQLMLGHSSFKTTEGYYNESADQDTSESMKAVFGRGKSRKR